MYENIHNMFAYLEVLYRCTQMSYFNPLAGTNRNTWKW